MKKIKALRQTFGISEYGWIDFPGKISGVQISRILYGDEMGCSRCFPHGFEVVNAKHKISAKLEKIQESTMENKKTGAVKQNCFVGVTVMQVRILLCIADGVKKGTRCCERLFVLLP